MSLAARLNPLPITQDAQLPAHWKAGCSAAQSFALDQAWPLLNSIFERAPYLWDIAERQRLWLADALLLDPSLAIAHCLADIANLKHLDASEELVSATLRIAKSRVALLSAIAEIGGAWGADQTTRALSDLADAALEASLEFLVREAIRAGKIHDNLNITAANCGLCIFALGKHGGQELNYSSDIDIVVFFDPLRNVIVDPEEIGKTYVRMVRKLVALMQDRTEHGYVFRTDIRLRPDPGSTPVAISVDAAMAYYESRGQNWERAAWIKARACAGDIEIGLSFLKELAPFTWRKHLDYATITDIQAMKRQINIHKNVGEMRVLGHNVKLGRGGIREIEFFVQTQQLIAGGRDKSLRVRPTVQALDALCDGGWISVTAADDLVETYWFLRAVENRLQMLRDEQTHVLPETEIGVAIIADLMGFSSFEDFSYTYRAALTRVVSYYSDLFADGQTLASDIGNLVFTGSDDDPGTLETLQELGFSDPKLISDTIRRWHYGAFPATRTAKAREHLTELIPQLLKSMSEFGDPDSAFTRFHEFLTRLPTGVQMFAILRQHPHLLNMLIEFMSSAPRLAEAVIHRAHVVDGLVDPQFSGQGDDPTGLIEVVDAFLADASSYEDRIDRARIIGQEQKFLISAGLVSGALSPAQAGGRFSALAETLVTRLFTSVQTMFAERHGKIEGAQVCLLAFGKLASEEMTATSDLDFIMLYSLPESSGESDGAKPLDPTTYFTRLTQRLLSAISAPTAEGVLYEVDMRLRPSGNSGPLATSLSRFIHYQNTEAWTWEHLALTRARVLGAASALSAQVDAAISELMQKPKDIAKVTTDVLNMRSLMARERPARHEFDLKLQLGGLFDIEFIAQTAQVLFAEKLNVPQAPTQNVLLALAQTGVFSAGDRLAEIQHTYSGVLELMSSCLSDPLKDEGWTPAFKDLLARRLNYPSFEVLQSDIKGMQAEVIGFYDIFFDQIASA